jgi:hypothetical protein
MTRKYGGLSSSFLSQPRRLHSGRGSGNRDRLETDTSELDDFFVPH